MTNIEPVCQLILGMNRNEAYPKDDMIDLEGPWEAPPDKGNSFHVPCNFSEMGNLYFPIHYESPFFKRQSTLLVCKCFYFNYIFFFFNAAIVDRPCIDEVNQNEMDKISTFSHQSWQILLNEDNWPLLRQKYDEHSKQWDNEPYSELSSKIVKETSKKRKRQPIMTTAISTSQRKSSWSQVILNQM